MKLSPIQFALKKAWENTMLLSMYGRHKDYVACHKDLASKAVKHFQEYLITPKPSIKVPVFSKEGLNMLSVMIKDAFRKKTPDEKLFKKMIFEEQVKQKLQKGMYV